jgi:hypothetical protein
MTSGPGRDAAAAGPPPSAALAGVLTGVQSQGVWAGRRQIFVRFAGEAETATMYSAPALAGELKRLTGVVRAHSVSVGGYDALDNAAFLAATFFYGRPTIPVMLDTDGQRPGAVAGLRQQLTLVQVTIDFLGPKSAVDRAIETVSVAAGVGMQHALVLNVRDDTTDAQLLRTIEQAHGASSGTMVVIHPNPAGERPAFGGPGPAASLDRRWSALLDQAQGVHDDVRLQLRLPAPAGMR